MAGSHSLHWRHNESDGDWNNRHIDCLLIRFFGRRSKNISKLHATSLCDGNSPVTDESPAQGASDTENVSIWWRHHVDTNYWGKVCRAGRVETIGFKLNWVTPINRVTLELILLFAEYFLNYAQVWGYSFTNFDSEKINMLALYKDNAIL